MSDFFYSLTPDAVLDAVEKCGRRSTGRALALNSLENRVYEVEMEEGESVVGKFYRPGRWSKESILEEHLFLADLAESEIPVVVPLKFSDGSTLGELEGGIYFTVFPKVRGRAPEELTPDQFLQLGRFVGRIHNVGAARSAPNRIRVTPENFGRAPLKLLVEKKWIPMELINRYQHVVEDILDIITPWFSDVPLHRIHGDCHLGNLLYDQQGSAFFLDFDDMALGPAVQDFWLLMPSVNSEAAPGREIFLKGYSEMREFDKTTLRLIEPLRTLRIVNYSAWIGKRWEDPAFKRIFPDFDSHRYWESEILDLNRQKETIRQLI